MNTFRQQGQHVNVQSDPSIIIMKGDRIKLELRIEKHTFTQHKAQPQSNNKMEQGRNSPSEVPTREEASLKQMVVTSFSQTSVYVWVISQ